MRRLTCLRCGTAMDGPDRRKIQLGEQGVFSNHWAHLMAGALVVDIYCCPKCGKLEMFAPYEVAEQEADSGGQRECPGCGLSVDAEYTKCPCCGAEL